MFLLTGNHPDMARLQITAIEAPARGHVEYVVKLSALGASDHSKLPIGRADYEAQAALMASGIRWTKATSYRQAADIIAATIGKPVRFVDETPEQARARRLREDLPPAVIERAPALSAYQRAGGKP